MLNARVDENELVALWIPWEVLELARAAVETHEVTLLAVNRGEKEGILKVSVDKDNVKVFEKSS